jgi:ferrous iron transport protein B
MLESLGKILAPIFAPLGFNNWALVSALIAGLVAKEVILSSIAMFNGVKNGTLAIIGSSVVAGGVAVFSSQSAVLSYLVFCLLYFPCLASISVLIKEIGWKWTLIGAVIEFLTAYVLAFVVYNLARAVEVFGLWWVILSIIGVASVIISVIFVIKKIKGKSTCSHCKHCNKNCK